MIRIMLSVLCVLKTILNISEDHCWKSENIRDSYIIIRTKDIRTRIHQIALKSCITNHCANGIKIEGSLDGEQFDEFCRYKGDYNNFYQKIGTFTCSNRTHAYEYIRLSLSEPNQDEQW